jgi:hypothetical protein
MLLLKPLLGEAVNLGASAIRLQFCNNKLIAPETRLTFFGAFRELNRHGRANS